MSDASERLSKTLEALQAERTAQGSARVTEEELLYSRVIRYVRRSNVDCDDALDGEDLLEELAAKYFSRPVPADMREAIEGKIQQARALAPVQKKNPGGRPQIYDWDAFWIEIVRIALVDELPDRDKMRETMRAWVATNFPDDPKDSPSKETAIRERLRKLYETPGIVP